ncbi:MAG: hypothetical protein IJX89_04650 [Alphaproteobacteria bacterium]|nr:hypothetical protein [Alphaproteobacteria bacterium]
MKKIICILGIVLGGCTTTQNLNPEHIHIDSLPDDCIKNIRINGVEYVENGNMKITVSGEVYNDTDLYYSTAWFNDSGIKINTLLSKYVKQTVKKGLPFYWTIVAPSSKAVDYKVYVSNTKIEQ